MALQSGDTRSHITTWEGGWVQVKVPVPFSLKWVNSYLVCEESGYTLIDPGLRTDEAIALWEDVLRELECEWTDISRIIVTHQHPDHYGLAGYVQQKSGAPVYITKAAHDYTQRLWSENSRFSEQLQSLYGEHGMPEQLREAIGINLSTFVDMVSPQPEVTYIEAGSSMQIGGKSWLLIDAPGHANGQLCFYEQEQGWMLCGDQVLPRITPNVSVVPGEAGDPLDLFLRSLEQLRGFRVTLAYPGHRDPFTDFSGRIDELLQHHERRLKQICGLLGEEPRTAFAMCEALFGAHLRTNAHNLRFAMSETLAHLVYLERKGEIHMRQKEGEYEYFVTAG